MSYVIGVITEDKAIIMSDGRTRSISTNDILSEEYNKTRKIKNNFDFVIIDCMGRIKEMKFTRDISVGIIA